MAAKLALVLLLQIVAALAASIPDQGAEAPRKWSISFGYGRNAEDQADGPSEDSSPRLICYNCYLRTTLDDAHNSDDAPEAVKSSSNGEKGYWYPSYYYPYYRSSKIEIPVNEEAPRKWHITFGYGREDQEAAPAPEAAPLQPAEPIDAPTDAVEQD